MKLRNYQLPFEEGLILEMEKNGILQTFSANTIVMEEGKILKFLPLMLKGEIRVFKKDLDKDREILLYYVKEGQSCMMSVVSILRKLPVKMDGICVEDSDVLLIPAQYVIDWQLRFPDWNQYLMKGIEERYSDLIEAFEAVSFYKLDERLEKFLTQYTKEKNSSIVHLSHQEIAQELGTTRVVVSRLLKSMEQQKKLKMNRGFLQIF